MSSHVTCLITAPTHAIIIIIIIIIIRLNKFISWSVGWLVIKSVSSSLQVVRLSKETKLLWRQRRWCERSCRTSPAYLWRPGGGWGRYQAVTQHQTLLTDPDSFRNTKAFDHLSFRFVQPHVAAAIARARGVHKARQAGGKLLTYLLLTTYLTYLGSWSLFYNLHPRCPKLNRIIKNEI